MPRKYVRKTTGPAYTKEDLVNAVRDVENRNKTFREAQAHYNVPIAVISQRLNGRKTPLDSAGRGRPTALSKEVEDQIANCLIERAKMGYPCDKDELCNLVEEYVKTNKIKTPFVNDRPGDEWYYAFMKRHDKFLSAKKPEHLQKCRKDARKPDIIYDFYGKLEEITPILGFNNPEMASFMFNADESGFRTDPSRIRAIGQKGKALSRVSGGSGRESITVLACISADGLTLPPMIVFKGAGVQARWTSDKAFPGTLYTVSKNGWMEEPQFYNWFQEGFIRHVENLRQQKNLPKQAAVLLYDGHASHISVRIVEAARSHNITLIKLPSHLTDKLQPLDKCVFGPVKTCWEKKLISHGKKRMGEGSGRLSKSEFVELLGMVWVEAMKKENIISGFRTSGVYPVDRTKFPQSEFTEADLEAYNLAQRRMRLNVQTNSPISISAEINNTSNLVQDLQPGPSGLQRSHQQGGDLRGQPELLSLHSPLPTTKTSSQEQLDATQETPVDLIDPHVQNLAEMVPTSPQPVQNNSTDSDHSIVLQADQLPGHSDIEKLFFKRNEVKKPSVENETLKKKVIPRLKQHTYGEVLTTEEVLTRLKDAEEKKSSKGKHKEKNMKAESNGSSKINNQDEKNKKVLKRNKERVESNDSTENEANFLKKKKQKRSAKNVETSSDDSSDESEVEYDSGGLSPEEIDDNIIDINPAVITDLSIGDFILVKFKGGRRNTTNFKYVCVVENLEASEVEVMGLKRTDDSSTNFAVVTTDVSFIQQEQIVGLLPFPTIQMKGERIFYHFEKSVPVLEQ